jgi:hypothetical protein
MEETRELTRAERMRVAEERDATIAEENRGKSARLANAQSKLVSTLDPAVEARRARLGLKTSGGTPWKEAGQGAPRAGPRAYTAPPRAARNSAPVYGGSQHAALREGSQSGDQSKTWIEVHPCACVCVLPMRCACHARLKHMSNSPSLPTHQPTHTHARTNTRTHMHAHQIPSLPLRELDDIAEDPDQESRHARGAGADGSLSREAPPGDDGRCNSLLAVLPRGGGIPL